LQVVVKSQILAGGRGLGKFKNGFQGGVHIVNKKDAKSVAEKMLGQTLVTKQTGDISVIIIVDLTTSF
jgi:succinyl-CoA synthetase beta subunit